MASRIATPSMPLIFLLHGNTGIHTRTDKGFDLRFSIRPEYATITLDQVRQAVIKSYGDRLQELVSVEPITSPYYTYKAHVVLRDWS